MRIVAFDLETTDLKALMGRILCASFLEVTPPGYYSNHHDTPPTPYTFRADRNPWKDKDIIHDKHLAIAIRDELEGYNMVISWNGKMFDVPLLNARLMKFGERPCRIQFHVDLMYFAGGASTRIGSRKLDNVQRFLSLPDSKTRIDWEDWQRASQGNKRAFDCVVRHCEQDVKVLAESYWRFLPHVANIHR